MEQVEREWAPTRAAGLERLAQFVERAGPYYTEHRNYDLGPQARDNISGLGPYLSHRLITESEVATAVLAHHKPKDAESFLQQLCWRTYWQGWLEGRPQIYHSWKRLLSEDSRRWPNKSEYQSAVSGETGIEAFDFWVRELKSTGYLHNHARMWFASIWIFTLKLPWSLGAAFFLQHLLDGDAASNTLSWRWVAGWQTQGKNYAASAANIEKFTAGRFDPQGQLAEKPSPLGGPQAPKYVSPVDYPFRASEQLGEDYALLLTGDDLAFEEGVLAAMKPKLLLTLDHCLLDFGSTLSKKVIQFKAEAELDAVERAKKHFDVPHQTLAATSDLSESFGLLMNREKLDSLLYFQPFVGAWQELTTRLTSRDVGVRFFPLRRPWDGLLHPFAGKGYFQFKKSALPQIIRAKGKL